MNGPVWHWIEADGRHWEASHAVLLQKTRVVKIRPRVALRRLMQRFQLAWVIA
jgi:hypothetical protein